MKKELLHKYFRNEDSPKELEEILDWFEESDQHKISFLSERKLWNTTMLQNEENKTKKTKPIIRTIMWQIGSFAAMFLLLLGFWNYSGRAQEQQIITVPAGQRANIILADGTSVWLNSNTTLTYPIKFGRKQREVTVNGEAYFEVAHDKKHPFIVNTKNYEIEVLGTTFNLNAYSDYDMFKTALLEGSVKIHDKKNNTSLLLQPNECAVEVNGELRKTFGLPADNYSWKKGVLVFNDEPIHDVLKQLSAYYSKDILLQHKESENYRCTSKFLYNNGLDYILKVLQRDLHYTIEKDSINNVVLLR